MDRPNTPKVDEHGLAPVSFPLFETYDKILGRPHLPDEADTEDFLKATSIVVSMPPPSSDVAPTSERDPQLFDSSNNLLASWVDSEDTAMVLDSTIWAEDFMFNDINSSSELAFTLLKLLAIFPGPVSEPMRLTGRSKRHESLIFILPKISP